MKYQSFTAVSALCALGLSALLVPGCGGRYQTTPDVDHDTAGGGSRGAPSASRGGSPSRAGASGAGASSAGASGAGASSAGASGAGASSAGASSAGACGTVDCSAPVCPVGSRPILPKGACCEICQGTCPTCPGPTSCPFGSHPEVLGGNCCPTCVDDGAAACQMGLRTYATVRQQILGKYQSGCASDSECVTIAPANLCERACSFVAVWDGAEDSFYANLSLVADSYCSSCMPGPTPRCPRSAAARCIDAQCTLTELVPK